MSDLPELQQAWLVIRRGSPSDALSFRTDWPVPTKLKPGEVLVKVQAAALNPVGYKLMKWLPNLPGIGRPLVAEHDLAGVIVDGNGTEFKPGDQVFGFVSVELSMATSQGALAQYIRLPADHLALRPSNISAIEASGITLAAQTAHQALFDIGKLETGQTIFINGGSSAVGAFAIQLAKAAGARVFTTASGRNEQFVRKLGADEFIDYTQVSLPQYLAENPPSPKFHLILDAVALVDPSLYTHSSSYLQPNGIFISTGPTPPSLSFSNVRKIMRTLGAMIIPSWLGGVGRRYSIVMLKNSHDRLLALRKALEEGQLKPVVDSVHDFCDVLKAYDRMMSSRATGKIVVKVDEGVE
ncbi:hypothetical protein AMATHDRAFT_140283 [Amanita thiersii Skay4041]|uniref:Enoyl reductase (ER) domain-containing protein n=1 Tax=Amanita thiersii Skay4041 TaxID=703135 RepID=A0A2A9NSW8_9AGAR|nr:hypothetical protein AMATHDRAFT_140283 [Amanita thiersii Skay4041]